MSKVWNDEEGKVLLARFPGSSMTGDQNGKQSRFISDYVRVKTYVKPEEMHNPSYPIFPAPYTIAQHRLGGTWNDYNSVAIVQVAACNIRCEWCFVDRQLLAGSESSAAWFTPEEVRDMFVSTGMKMWRLSGGEPTLAPKFILRMIELLPPDCYLWIDTNLVSGDKFLEEFHRVWPVNTPVDTLRLRNVGICGCFKGFTCEDVAHNISATMDRDHSADLLTEQIAFARQLVKYTALDCYFYVTDGCAPSTTNQDIQEFFDRIVGGVDPMAPLRTYILQLKPYTPSQADWFKKHTGRVKCVNGDWGETARPIDIWERLKWERYPASVCWLPQYQIEYMARGVDRSV